jgi:hypothetical protein
LNLLNHFLFLLLFFSFFFFLFHSFSFFFFPPTTTMDRAAIDDTTIASTSSPSAIAPVLSLSNTIFKSSGATVDAKFSSAAEWESLLVNHHGSLFTGSVADAPVSFVLAFLSDKDQLKAKIREHYAQHLKDIGDLIPPFLPTPLLILTACQCRCSCGFQHWDDLKIMD